MEGKRRTVLYEIDMLRHCSKTLPAKKAIASVSDEAQAEYNLGIEGFLIHLRNLLAFFTTQHSRKSDLRLDRPNVWRERPVEAKEYSDLRDKAQAFNATFNDGGKLDCYELISKFLQHCTPERYEHAIWWDIEKMSQQIDPILTEFEKRFPARTSAAPVLPVTDAISASTTGFTRHSASIVSPLTKKED